MGYLNKLICYTDASISIRYQISACSYCILYKGILIKHDVIIIEGVDVNASEGYAILFALNAASEIKYVSEIEIFTDSKSNISVPKKQKKYQKILSKRIKEIESNGIAVKLTYVKAHAGVKHNELVDKSSKKQINNYIKDNIETKYNGYRDIKTYN